MKTKEKVNREVKEIMSILNEGLLDYDRTEIVEVVWQDARTLSGTSSYQEVKQNGLVTARTIGYLIHENEDSIAICGFLFPDESHSLQDLAQNTAFRDVHFIPKGWIKAVKVLKVDWEETKKFRENHKDYFIAK